MYQNTSSREYKVQRPCAVRTCHGVKIQVLQVQSSTPQRSEIVIKGVYLLIVYDIIEL